jgi:hypothetical protein
VRNRQKFIVPVELSEDFSSDVAGESFTDESLTFLTAITKVGHYLLAVNGQFDRRESRDPAELPFSFTSVTIPE